VPEARTDGPVTEPDGTPHCSYKRHAITGSGRRGGYGMRAEHPKQINAAQSVRCG